MHRIMLVDDEPNVLKALARALARPEYDIETFASPAEALRRAQTAPFDLVMSDYRMPQMDGVSLLIELKALQPDMMRLILSAYGDLEAIMAAINKAEIYRFTSKPWDDYDLKRTVEHALTQHDMLLENRRLADQVRRQQLQLNRQEAALKELETKHPEIARVVWQSDGSILLDEHEAD